MNWSDWFVNTDALVFQLRDQAERERRVRRLVTQTHDEKIETLARDSAQLELLLSALLSLLVDKGIPTEDDVRRKLQQLAPPAPPPPDANAFADLSQ